MNDRLFRFIVGSLLLIGVGFYIINLTRWGIAEWELFNFGGFFAIGVLPMLVVGYGVSLLGLWGGFKILKEVWVNE